MCFLTHARQAYVATLYTAFEVDEETTQETTQVFTGVPFVITFREWRKKPGLIVSHGFA
jgi:hypothetical protein